MLFSGDFKSLQQRSHHHTSTPFISRTALTCPVTASPDDSGVYTSFSSSVSTCTLSSSCSSSGIDSALLNSADSVGVVQHPVWSPVSGSLSVSDKLFLPASKCSDTDSAFGDVSLSSHEQSQLSDTSYMEIQFIGSSHSHLASQCSADIVQCNTHTSSTSRHSTSNHGASSNIFSCSDSGIYSTNHHKLDSLNTDKSTGSDISAQSDLSLPTPSWCSPVPYPYPPCATKPAATSTPQNPVNPREVHLLPENILDLLKNFSPPEPDRLIGRNMGLETVDVISELYSRGIHSLQTIFNYLDPQDLCRYFIFIYTNKVFLLIKCILYTLVFNLNSSLTICNIECRIAASLQLTLKFLTFRNRVFYLLAITAFTCHVRRY